MEKSIFQVNERFVPKFIRDFQKKPFENPCMIGSRVFPYESYKICRVRGTRGRLCSI